MLERVREIIQEQLNLEGIEITEESSFKDDLGADSLDVFQIIMGLEQIHWICLNLLWLLKRNTALRFLLKIWSRLRQSAL